MKFGIFDSGIGGEAVAAVLQQTFPKADIIVVNDKKNVPYGTKSVHEIIRLTTAAIQPLITAECDVIVIACNTGTAVAIEQLRTIYPGQKFIGIEPMIKTAADMTRSGIIAVCATPATLSSKRYDELKNKYASALTIIEPDCSNWARLIENNQLNRNHIESIIHDVCKQGADVIVLGCTHYHWIKENIAEVAGGHATVIEPSDAIGRRVTQLLELG